MFNSISWNSYWTVMALLLAGYYLAVYLLYFRNDFSLVVHRPGLPDGGEHNLPGGLTKEGGSVTGILPDDESSADFQPPVDGSEEQLVYSCMDELNAFFAEARSVKWTKEDLVRSLQYILKKYPSLQSSAYRESLTGVILTQCKQLCSVHLKDEQVVRVWQHE